MGVSIKKDTHCNSPVQLRRLTKITDVRNKLHNIKPLSFSSFI